MSASLDLHDTERVYIVKGKSRISGCPTMTIYIDQGYFEINLYGRRGEENIPLEIEEEK